MGETARRELSPIEKGMAVAFFWFFAKPPLLVSLQAALDQPLKSSFSGLQNAIISRTSLGLGDPKNSPNVSGERFVVGSLPESNGGALDVSPRRSDDSESA